MSPTLSRLDSDYLWYRERLRSLDLPNSHLKLNLNMADGHLVSAPLNPEPADPKERQKHNLQPKSFADAVQEPADHETSQSQTSTRSYASSATAVDDHKENFDENKLVYEKHLNASRDEVLTSVKPDERYEESLKHDGATAPRERRKKGQSKRQDPPEEPLASGRKAGAGWQTSA
jgi:hypothetical protein